MKIMQTSKFEKYMIKIYQNNPKLRPIMKKVRDIVRPIPTKFSGWGMTSIHTPPWSNHSDAKIFLNAAKDIKKIKFRLIKSTGDSRDNIDDSLWRHWIVSYAINHAIKFSCTKKINFVECGVGEGISAFFSLRQIVNNSKSSMNSEMHLYDAWSKMKKDFLLDSELNSVGKYSELNIEIAKENLKEFEKITIYHQGYIPESFNKKPKDPESINYIHIDLNSAKPTIEALKFFYPKLEERGIILFDDYGAVNYIETRKMIDNFFKDKEGIIFETPTGQAIFYK
jgi:O-methyltransferase